MLTTIITGYFLVEVYNAELTSYLTSQEVKLPISRVEDILDNNMKYSVIDGTFMKALYQFSDEEEKQRLWKEKIEGQKYGLINWDYETISAAIKENYVVSGYGNAVLDYVGQFPCFATTLPIEPAAATQIGIYLEKNSPLSQLFIESLQFLQESGIVESIKQNNAKKRLMSTKVCTNEDLKLGIQSTIFLFLLILLGITSSLILLILECVLSPFSYKDEERQNVNSSNQLHTS